MSSDLQGGNSSIEHRSTEVIKKESHTRESGRKYWWGLIYCIRINGKYIRSYNFGFIFKDVINGFPPFCPVYSVAHILQQLVFLLINCSPATSTQTPLRLLLYHLFGFILFPLLLFLLYFHLYEGSLPFYSLFDGVGVVPLDFFRFRGGLQILAGVPDDLLLLFHDSIAIEANAKFFDDFGGG